MQTAVEVAARFSGVTVAHYDANDSPYCTSHKCRREVNLRAHIELELSI